MTLLHSQFREQGSSTQSYKIHYVALVSVITNICYNVINVML